MRTSFLRRTVLLLSVVITISFNIIATYIFIGRKKLHFQRGNKLVHDTVEEFLTPEEKIQSYSKTSKSFLLQQSCGTNFSVESFGVNFGNSPEVLTDINPNYPLLESFKNVFDVKEEVLVIVMNEMLKERTSNWWIERGIKEFKIDILFAFEKNDLLRLIESIGSKKNWFLVVSPYTYVFLTNFLSFVKYETVDLTNEKTDPFYFGYPYRNDKMIYGPLSAGIIFNQAAAWILSSEREEFVTCRKLVEECIGSVMKNNEIDMIDLDTLAPESPDVMMTYLDDLIPRYHVRREMKETIYNRPITFGNMKKENMNKLEKVHKIPKILHQIWIGDQSKRPKYIEKCKKIYEENGWKHVLWTDENMEEYQEILINKNLYNSLKEYPGKADLLRMEILFKIGGVVIDADSECFSVMDEVIEETYINNFQMFAACENENYRPGLYAVGVQGSAPFSLTYYILLRSAHLVKNHELLYQKRKSISWIITGPLFLTRVIKNFNLPVYVINSCRVYPVHWIDFKKKDFETNFDVEEIVKNCKSYTFQYWGSTKSNYNKFLRMKREALAKKKKKLEA